MDLKILEETPPWDWPDTTNKLLLDILRNNQAEETDRLLAAELAGDFTVINDELVDILLSILENDKESEKLRAKAVISLGPVLEYADTDGLEDPDDVPISAGMFRRVQELLRKLYLDAEIPKEVRRRILETSVRVPQDWHQDAIRAAYASDNKDWKLTAVFSMCWIRGFNEQILEALGSDNEEIHYQAVCAAGNWEVDAAWSHVSGLVASKETDKPLLLAAIGAVASIRPEEAGAILVALIDSDDEDIAEAVFEAMAMAEGSPDEVFDEDQGDELPWRERWI